MRKLIVIPARMASQRFPGKPLADLAGKPMIQWVWEACQRAEITEEILVATPDEEILRACEQFGARAVRTRLDHPTGTDRLAEVAEAHLADRYLNIQGDEPLLSPESIRALDAAFDADPGVGMTSVCCPCLPEGLDDPSVVKVVRSLSGRALYFSRSRVPFPRVELGVPVWRHLGLYGFTREVLLQFRDWPQTPLERTESLEQLRFLEHGVAIGMAEVAGSEIAVDTPEQADEVRRILSIRG